jgi:hypothetical protein
VHSGSSSGRPKFPPVLRVALKSSTSGCPFEVGPVGLAPTKIHMVVGDPRSYLTTRASTLALKSERSRVWTPTPDLAARLPGEARGWITKEGEIPDRNRLMEHLILQIVHLG